MHHPKLINSYMNKEQLNDIQKSLNWIRSQAEEADAASKVEVLALLNATSQSVIQMAKKLTAPKAKTISVIVPPAVMILGSAALFGEALL